MPTSPTKKRQIVLRFNNGTDAIAFEPLELNYYTEPISPTGLIRMQGGAVLKQLVATAVETLDPDTNPSGRFNEGVTIECEVAPENFGTPVTHPALDGARITTKPWLAEDGVNSKTQTLEIELSDTLAFVDNPAPVDDASGLDISGPGQTITATINAYLVDGGATALVNTGPTEVTRRTWQVIDRQSRIATAGEIAFGAGVYFIWEDENNDIRIIDYDTAVATPRFTITESQLADNLTRIRTSEYARRFEKVVARGNLVEVDDCQFGDRTIFEEFRTPNQLNPVYSDNTTQYLVQRDEESTSLVGNVFTSVVTKTRLLQVGAPSPSTWTNYVNEVITTVDTFNTDGLLSSRVITKQAALIFSADEDELFTVDRTTITYTYNTDKSVAQIQTLYDKPLIQSGIGVILFDVATNPNRDQAFLGNVGGDLEDYQQTPCGFTRTVTTLAGTDATNGPSAYQVVYTPVKELGTTNVTRPPAPPTIPRPALKETPIESECVIFPGNGTPSNIRTTDITLRFVSSQAALDKACAWYAAQLWQKSTTYRVVMPYLDVIRTATASPNSPFFSFDLQRNDGTVLRLLWDDIEYVFDGRETLVVCKAQLIAIVSGGNAIPVYTIPFNAQRASGAGTAYDATLEASAQGFVVSDTASGAGTANDAVFTEPTEFTADGPASGTGTANDATFEADVVLVGETASGTGTANDATFTNSADTFAQDATASGTGTANDAAYTNSEFIAETASGTGTANDAVITNDGGQLSWLDITEAEWLDMTEAQWLDIQN